MSTQIRAAALAASTAMLAIAALALPGCTERPTPDPSPPASSSESGTDGAQEAVEAPGAATGARSHRLADSAWVATAIDGEDLLEDTVVSLAVRVDGSVSGSTGCNRYFGRTTVDHDAIAFSEVGSTRRACAAPVMNQEQRFLAGLGDARGYRIDPRSGLLVFDAEGRQRLALRRVEADPTVADLPR